MWVVGIVYGILGFWAVQVCFFNDLLNCLSKRHEKEKRANKEVQREDIFDDPCGPAK
jgi:hypothetical protein